MPEEQRTKKNFYLDAGSEGQERLIDDLLTELVRQHGLPRDSSMLIRALLEEARPALTDSNRLAALAEACRKTPPKNR